MRNHDEIWSKFGKFVGFGGGFWVVVGDTAIMGDSSPKIGFHFELEISFPTDFFSGNDGGQRAIRR